MPFLQFGMDVAARGKAGVETVACILADFASYFISNVDKVLDQRQTPGQVKMYQIVTEALVDKDNAIRRRSSGQALTIPSDSGCPGGAP